MNKDSIAAQIQREQNELNKLSKALAEFPDLKKHTNRWQHVRYASAKANEQVTDVDIAHNCGCCEDSPLEVWPYLMFNGLKIYSEPECFTVGEKIPFYSGSGERPYDGWQDKMREAKIPEAVIAKVQDYFNENSPKRIMLVDDDEL